MTVELTDLAIGLVAGLFIGLFIGIVLSGRLVASRLKEIFNFITEMRKELKME